MKIWIFGPVNTNQYMRLMAALPLTQGISHFILLPVHSVLPSSMQPNLVQSGRGHTVIMNMHLFYTER